MPKVDDLRELKRVVSARLLGMPGVAGVGVPKGTLTIYLAYDSAGLRKEITRLVQDVAPNLEPDFLVTGTFEAQA